MKRKYIFSLILIFGMIAGMTQTSAVVTSIDFSGKTFAFDLFHGGYHAEDLDNLIANVSVDNTVVYINETWSLDDAVDALFLTEADGAEWSASQIADVVAWFDLGDKFLWLAGDSDYGGYYNQTRPNAVVEAIGAHIKLDGTSISDPVFSDGSSYRAAAPYFGSGDPLDTSPLLAATMQDCTAGAIFHGPCAILGDNGTHTLDLRLDMDEVPGDIIVLMRYSGTAVSDDSDASFGDDDLYSVDAITGYYPALVYEAIDDSHLVLSGEAIYSDYKYMYDQKTENGAYNDGVQFGQVIVNNILNFIFGEPAATSAAFVVLPLVAIGAIYVLMKRK